MLQEKNRTSVLGCNTFMGFVSQICKCSPFVYQKYIEVRKSFDQKITIIEKNYKKFRNLWMHPQIEKKI